MWSYVFMGLDSLLVGILYSFYRKREEAIRNILNAPSARIGPELGDLLEEKGNSIDYVVLRGKVHPYGTPITSESGLKGVMQVVTIKEHSVNRELGHWYESVRPLQQSQKSVSFALKNLVSTEPLMLVEVETPFEAKSENLLMPVSTNFLPTKATLASTLWGFFSGHNTQGLETTEDFLPVNTVVTGIGKVTKDSSGHILISEPRQGDLFPYFLSTLPAESIAKRLQSRNAYLKVTTYILATVGIIVAVRTLGGWWKLRQQAKMRNRILRNRTRHLDGLSPAEICVVCLVNPREILIMNCGHVAVCADCCPKLNNKCPICRKDIQDTHEAYIA